MTQTEFTLLNEIEQEEIVWDYGIYVNTHQKDDLILDVYSMGEFYVQFAYKLYDYKSFAITVLNKSSVPELYQVK